MTCPGEVIVVHFILDLGRQKVQQFLLLSFFPYKSIIFGAFALAQVLAVAIMPGGQPELVEGIKPNDDVASFGEKLNDLQDDTLMAGHLPFMARLVAWFITGNKDLGMRAYWPGSVVCLEQQEEGGWTLEWMVRPELLED